MGATGQTTTLLLPQFSDDDRPTWRGDFNGAMNLIDQAFGELTGRVQDDELALDQNVANYVGAPGSKTRGAADLRYVVKGQERVNVKDYGAKLDGATDDTNAWNAALAAVATGGTILIPGGTMLNGSGNPWQVTKQVNIDGYGATIKTNSTTATILNVAADMVTFRGVTIAGVDYTAYAANNHGITATGTPGTPVKRMWLRDVSFVNLRAMAVRAQYVERFKFIDCNVNGMTYAGFMFMSAKGCEVRGGTIENVVNPAVPNAPSYGVAFTRGNGDAVADPRSENCKATGITLNNVNWEALDTHGGKRITFAANIITACYRGIALVAAPIGAVDTFAPVDCNVTGNTIDSLATDDGRFDAAITFVGAFDGTNVAEYATGTIAGNTVRGHGSGTAGNTNVGGVTFYYTRGLTISGNVAIECSGAGAFSAYRDNVGFNMTGNTAIDPWSSTYAGVSAYHVRNLNNSGNISGNNHFAGSKTGVANLNLYGIRFSSSTNVAVTVGVNNLSGAATPVYQGTANSLFAVLDKPPVVKAAAPGVAAGSDATVINAIVTALRNVGIVT